MNEENKSTKDLGNKSKIAFVFGVFMVIIYSGMGILLLFTDIFAWKLSETTRIVLGTLLVFYGIFRGYRVIRN